MRVPEHMRAIAAAAATSPLRSATRYAETVDGLISILFAATYPERVVGLVLLDAYARFTEDDGYFGWDSAEGIADTAAYAAAWGTGESVAFMAPAQAEDVEFKERLARMERLS